MTGTGYTSTQPTCLHGAYSGKFMFYRKTYGVGLGGGGGGAGVFGKKNLGGGGGEKKKKKK